MYKAAEPFIEAAAHIVDGACLYMLFAKFGAKRMHSGILTCILTMLAWSAANMLIVYFVFADPPYTLEKSLISFLLHSAVIYLIGLSLYRGRQIIRLFLTLLFIALFYLISEIGHGVRLFLVDGVEKLSSRHEAFQNITTVKIMLDSIYIFIDIAAIALLCFSIKTIVKNHSCSVENRSAKELIFNILPALLGSLISVVLYFMILMINEQGHIMDYDNYRAVYLFIIIVFAAVWLIILYGFRLQDEIANLQEERTQKSVLENQIVQMQDSMSEMEHFYEGVRHVKHDMKNQMAVMERLLRESQLTSDREISQYFEDMQSTLAHLEQTIHTGNVVSDAVISGKFHYAAREINDIHLDADDFFLTDKVRVRAYDIGVILNNGLDNAIEACKKVRLQNRKAEVYIIIKSFWKRKMFFIEIENSFDGEVTWQEDGCPRTTKADSRIHGIGLKNIRYCAEKYGGDMDCVAENKRFILTVMLKGQEAGYKSDGQMM